MFGFLEPHTAYKSLIRDAQLLCGRPSGPRPSEMQVADLDGGQALSSSRSQKSWSSWCSLTSQKSCPPPRGAADLGPTLSSPLDLPVSNLSLKTEPRPPCLKKKNGKFTSPSGFLLKTTSLPPRTPSECSALAISNRERGSTPGQAAPDLATCDLQRADPQKVPWARVPHPHTKPWPP